MREGCRRQLPWLVNWPWYNFRRYLPNYCPGDAVDDDGGGGWTRPMMLDSYSEVSWMSCSLAEERYLQNCWHNSTLNSSSRDDGNAWTSCWTL